MMAEMRVARALLKAGTMSLLDFGMVALEEGITSPAALLQEWLHLGLVTSDGVTGSALTPDVAANRQALAGYVDGGGQ